MDVIQLRKKEKTVRPESKCRGKESTARAQWVGRHFFADILILFV